MKNNPKKTKRRVYLVPVTWTMTGYYAIRARTVDEAIDKSHKLPLPNDGTYINDSCEPCHDEVAPLPKEFSHLPVSE